MFLFCIAFLFGDLCLQLFSVLPSMIYLFALLLFSVLLWVQLQTQIRYFYILPAFMLGFVFTAGFAHQVLSWTLPTALEDQPLLVSGYISSLPVVNPHATSFILSMRRYVVNNQVYQLNTNIKLNWLTKQPCHVGDKWQLLVKLKRIHGIQSPGSFDFEAWGLEKGLRAVGHVLPSLHNKMLAKHRYHYLLDQLRQTLQDKIQSHLPHSHSAPWLMALMIGERSGVATEDWEVLRNTGTNHLMAIAGLHIGVMVGLVHFIVTWLWRRHSRLLLFLPASEAAAYASLVTALIYSALAGFSLPTQRAFIMLCVFMLATMTRRKINAWQGWSGALLCVLFFNPLSVLTESFWLSFVTLALIIYGMSGRLAPRGIWWKWGRVQWVIGFGLFPLSLLFFQASSLVSLFANCVAIPWLGFLILPLCLLSSLLLFIAPVSASLLLNLADKSLAGLWCVLTWFSHFPLSSWQHAIPSHLQFIIIFCGFILVLLPSGFPGRWLGVIWLLPLFFFQPALPKIGELWLTLLDVDQGLAVVVQTASHLLVYDTGARVSANRDMGERVVLPFLRKLMAKQIDVLVISHGDNDHIGGAQAVLKALPALRIITSVPGKITGYPAEYCLSGMRWQWDNIKFEFIYPTKDKLNLDNDSSCVLRIDSGMWRILLPGDIEKFAENDLVTRVPHLLAADLLIAPHHGSKTSGVVDFIEAVHPSYVLYATGYRNRYHFPHQAIVNSYNAMHVTQFDTAKTGSIHIKMDQLNTLPMIELYREKHKHYWME